MPVVNAPKLDVDTDQRLLIVNTAPVLVDGEDTIDLDIQVDVYSDLKEVWQGNEVLRKMRFPVRSVGGDTLPGSKQLGDTYFLDSRWKIRAYEADHVWRINGNFYSEDGTSPFIRTLGSYNVFLVQQVSSLVDSTIQQLPEIEYASFGNQVTINATDGYALSDGGSDGKLSDGRIIGTLRAPVNNAMDAVTIANVRGFETLHVVGNYTFDTGDDVTGFRIVGQNAARTFLQLNPGAIIDNVDIQECTVTGTLDGNAILRTCYAYDLTYFSGFIFQCQLSGTITLGNNTQANILSCYAADTGTDWPIIDFAGSGQSLFMGPWVGNVILQNKTGTDKAFVSLNGGQVAVDLATCTNGTITVTGDGKCVDVLDRENHLPHGNYGSLYLDNETTYGKMVQEIWTRLDLDPDMPNRYADDGSSISNDDFSLDKTDNGDGTFTVRRT